MIFYSSPFRSDKNIGKANNDFIKLLPDDAWICITDGDALFPKPDYGTCIEKIISDNQDFDLISCQTNRLGVLKLCYENRFNEDMDARSHYSIANELWEKHGTLVDQTDLVAGVCMIFSKRTWLKVGGFKEGTILADRIFCKDVLKHKLKIGISKGLYIFHLYRIWEHGKGRAIAQQSIKHLKCTTE